MANKNGEKFVIAVEAVATHEDGGKVADLLCAITNADLGETTKIIESLYSFNGSGFSRSIRDEKRRRNNAHLGYTGNWSTRWDPHAVDQSLPHGDDGKIIYQ